MKFRAGSTYMIGCGAVIVFTSVYAVLRGVYWMAVPLALGPVVVWWFFRTADRSE